jgi:hypothetical protein
MKFRVHFNHNDGTSDSVIIEGDTIEECRQNICNFLEDRGLTWDNYQWGQRL